jgi:hypothetical protein
VILPSQFRPKLLTKEAALTIHSIRVVQIDTFALTGGGRILEDFESAPEFLLNAGCGFGWGLFAGRRTLTTEKCFDPCTLVQFIVRWWHLIVTPTSRRLGHANDLILSFTISFSLHAL